MYGYTRLIGIVGKGILLSVLLLTIVAGDVNAQSGRIVVLSGQDLKPYQEVLAGLQQSLTKQGINLSIEVHSLQGNQRKTQEILADVKRNSARLVVTLGSAATQAAVREVSHLPILATMIMSATDIQTAPNATAVLLDFPLDMQLEWLKRIVPGAGTVGILFHPQENQAKVTAAIRIVKDTGLKLMPQVVDSPRALPDALENISRSVDVLWGISDSMVMTPHTAEAILLSTLRNKIPLIGLSTSWVKAGALYALDRDYVDIGLQCGEVAGRVLGGTAPGSLTPMPPRKVTYAVNLKTAAVIDLELPPELIQGAAQVFQ
jgi:putative tryptophan/tyrosine transport system substrate-binding protein